MKKYIAIISLCALFLAAGCSKYDGSALLKRMDEIEARIENLSTLLEKLNAQTSSLKALVDAYQKGTTVADIEPMYEGGTLLGYKVILTDGTWFVIHEGQDGEDGYCGVDGRDGYTPAIGVVLIDGRYYWTVDGNLMRDASGNMIPASPDPSQSQAVDGYTPVISVVDGKWVVTVNGASYVVGDFSSTDVNIVDGIFSGVSQTDTAVTFTLADGTVITLDKAIRFYVIFTALEGYELSYAVTGATADVSVDVICEKGWSASVSKTGSSAGNILLTPDGPAVNASFMVLCSDGINEAASSISVVDGKLVL